MPLPLRHLVITCKCVLTSNWCVPGLLRATVRKVAADVESKHVVMTRQAAQGSKGLQTGVIGNRMKINQEGEEAEIRRTL